MRGTQNLKPPRYQMIRERPWMHFDFFRSRKTTDGDICTGRKSDIKTPTYLMPSICERPSMHIESFASRIGQPTENLCTGRESELKPPVYLMPSICERPPMHVLDTRRNDCKTKSSIKHYTRPHSNAQKEALGPPRSIDVHDVSQSSGEITKYFCRQ